MRCIHTCAANCGPPSPPMNGYIIPYISTREGAEVNITCPSKSQQQYMTICNGEGRWEPDSSGLCKNVSGRLSLHPYSRFAFYHALKKHYY